MKTQTHICLKEMGRSRAMLDISNKIQSLKISFIRKTSFLDFPSARQRNKSDMLRPQRDFFPLSLMVLWLLQSNGGLFFTSPHPRPVQCPATLTNISELKQKHKDQPGVEFTVKNSKRAKVGRQLDTHKQK